MQDFDCKFPDLKVLVIDDYKVSQMVIGALLKAMDCVVDIVSCGQEGVDMCKENNYDIIFTDIQMSDLNGYEVTKKIRKIEKELGLEHIIIIAITANSSDEDREKCLKAGMDDYVAKPITPAIMESILKKYFPHNSCFNSTKEKISQ